MLKNRNTAKLKNLEGKHSVIFDTNFDEDQEKIKITIGETVAVVSRQELFGITMLLGKGEEYDSLQESLPPKTTEVVSHTRAVTIKATKDIKEGEEVTFNIQYEVPKRIIEYLGGKKEVVE